MTSDTSSGGTGSEPLRRIPAHRLSAAVARTAAKEGWEPAQALIERHWDLYASRSPQHLLAAIRALPGEAFIERPTMLVAAKFLQHVLAGGDPSHFNHGEWMDVATTGGNTGLMDTLGVLTGKTAALRTEGDLVGAAQVARVAAAELDNASEAEQSEVQISLPHYRVQWARSLELGEASGADREYERAYDLSMATGQSAVARRAAAQLAWFYAERGRLRTAESWLARARAEKAINARYDAVVFLTEALIHIDRLDFAAAGRDLGRTRGLQEGEYWSAALWVESMSARTAAIAAVVESDVAESVERVGQTVANGGAHGRYLRAARARLSALRRPPGDNTAIPEVSTTDRIIAAAGEQARGEHRKALALAAPAMQPSEPPRTHAAALLISAAARMVLGQTARAVSLFEQAKALIDTERIFTSYDWVPDKLLHALARKGNTTLDVPDPLESTRQKAARDLTRRETEVLVQLMTHKTMAEIADDLFISPNTLKSTTRRLYRKIGASTRQDAIDFAHNTSGR